MDKAKVYIKKNKERFISELLDLLRIPSISAQSERKPDMLLPREECPRIQQIAKKKRYYLDENGKPVPKARVYQYRDAIAEPIINKLYEDPTLVSFGEDVRDWGGAFAVYRGMTEATPYYRLFNTPIAEAAIVGAAVGYGMSGGRAVAELMYCDFLGRAGDEVFNQLSKWQAMSAGILKMPVVLRMSVGSKYGAQHSQDWSAICAHISGLKVVFPATPYDAKGLMQSALNGTDPVIFLESQRIYDVAEQFHPGGVPEEEYEIPIGVPDIKRAGSDVTILSIGATLYRALKAADILQEKYGLSAEVIDARSIVPFDYSIVMESVKKTGRIVVTGDACERITDLVRVRDALYYRAEGEITPEEAAQVLFTYLLESSNGLPQEDFPFVIKRAEGSAMRMTELDEDMWLVTQYLHFVFEGRGGNMSSGNMTLSGNGQYILMRSGDDWRLQLLDGLLAQYGGAGN